MIEKPTIPKIETPDGEEYWALQNKSRRVQEAVATVLKELDLGHGTIMDISKAHAIFNYEINEQLNKTE